MAQVSSELTNDQLLNRLAFRLRLDEKHALHFVTVHPFRHVWTSADLLEKQLSINSRVININLAPSESSPIDRLIEQAPRESVSIQNPINQTGQKQTVLFIFGLNDILSKYNTYRDLALYHFNAERDRLRELISPTVFWLKLETLDLIATSLPDIWSWTTSVTNLRYPIPSKRKDIDTSESLASYFITNEKMLKASLQKRYSVLNSDELDDVLVNTYLSIGQRSQKLPAIANLASYFLSVAKYHASNMLIEKTRIKLVPLSEAENVVSQDLPLYEREINTEAINQALDLLDPQLRAIVILYYYEGASVQEVANVLGLSYGNVHRLLSRARQILADRIKM